VLYHLLVMLASQNVKLEDVYAVLEKRSGTSGMVEKSLRSK
jgi:phosphoribosyl-ATP pyrophosphohydrolase